MRPESPFSPRVLPDNWLEGQCRQIVAAGTDLAECVGLVNERLDAARAGELGRKRILTEAHVRKAADAHRNLRRVQSEVQNALFDCEHEIRQLRERDVSPAELLVDGERLIGHYRFLRRRARIIDGLLAYLPSVNQYSATCIDWLKHLKAGTPAQDEIAVPDCSFALIALEELQDVEAA